MTEANKMDECGTLKANVKYWEVLKSFRCESKRMNELKKDEKIRTTVFARSSKLIRIHGKIIMKEVGTGKGTDYWNNVQDDFDEVGRN